jgi:tetratricopeptide (TPR) repeat protein
MTVSAPAPFTRLATALICASSICVGPRVAAAAPAQAEAEQADADADAEPAPAQPSQAETLYRKGQAKYETADYAGAIEQWTEAYALVDPTPENAAIKVLLLYNLAQAHVKAHELDEDPIHLKQALQLLENFKLAVDLLYEDEAARAEELDKVEGKIDELEAKIAALEPEPEPEPEPKPEPPSPSAGPVDQGPVDGPRPGTPLIAAGAAVGGIGLAFGVVGVVGAVIGARANNVDGLDPLDVEAREDQFRRGRTGNALAVAGAILGGVLLPTGVALIAVGVTRNKRAASARVSLSPALSPQHAGLTLVGRF